MKQARGHLPPTARSCNPGRPPEAAALADQAGSRWIYRCRACRPWLTNLLLGATLLAMASAATRPLPASTLGPSSLGDYKCEDNPRDCPVTCSVFTNGFWNTSGARTKPTCSLTNAYLAALLSAYAYPTIFSGLSLGMHKEYEARLTEVLHPLGLSQLSLLYADDSFVHDTQVLVAATPTDVFIIHRGSSGYADTFITDLTLKCAPLPSDWAAPAPEGTPAAHANPTSHSACVHSGFLRAHTSIYGPLLDLLDTRFDVPPPPRLYSSTHATANGPMSTASAASDASSAAAAGATASATRYASVQVVHLLALRDGPQQEVVAEAGRRFISGQGSALREGMEEGVGHEEAGVEAGGGATLGMGRQAGRRLWVTGHSLGGAMATLTALGLKRQGYNVAGLYTFGSPRVGNAGFSRLFRDAGLWTRSYRFVNEDDAVPQVPLTVMGYAHVGQRWVCVGGKCEFVANEGCVHSGFIPGLCDINTADHSLSTGYLPALRQSLPQSVPQCAIDKLPTGDVQ
ncbi:hypothetical protein QJQ45_013902 [Haematococcus lacustris]|nr:hypothetical protein QJQ45_013902 [Haematococcus lacustris]